MQSAAVTVLENTVHTGWQRGSQLQQQSVMHTERMINNADGENVLLAIRLL